MSKSNKKPKKKVMDVTIIKVENDAVIIKVDGWRIRVYFDKSLALEHKKKLHEGKIITAEYEGNKKDIHSIKFLPLKLV